MVYFIFIVDGDWKEYFDTNLSEEKRLPNPRIMQGLVQREIKAADRLIEGKFIHFIHTSPRVRDFFLKEPFVKLWKKIVKGGGNIGLHCHEDDPYKAYYHKDTARMRSVIYTQASALRSLNLTVTAYRCGFLSFSNDLIPVLEKNGLRFDFSCEPGRCLVDADTLVADWRGSPETLYRMSYNDYRKEGNSGVYEVPVAADGGNYLYFEKADFKAVEKIAYGLKEKSAKENKDIIVSTLVHSYDYICLGEIRAIKKKISILKKYGRFINLKELQGIIEKSFKKG